MKIARSIEELRAGLPDSLSTGFVPTMGAFHEGHLELIRAAKRVHPFVVVSIFVNPTQFAPHEDLDSYPRQEEMDIALAERTGVDLLFIPSPEEMYPRKTTSVVVKEVTELWEGIARPGHFDGVATVVLKLFHLVEPHSAYFGLKDLQQCVVIRRMTEDLNLKITLHFMETVREKDGLAMSSRNTYLTPEQRLVAPKLYEILKSCALEIRSTGNEFSEHLLKAKKLLNELGFEVEYLEYVELETLRPIRTFVESCRIIVAARLGKVRLIDNVAV